MKVSDYVVLKVGSIIYLIVDIENDVVKLKGLNYRIYASANIQDVRLATPDEIKLEKEKCEKYALRITNLRKRDEGCLLGKVLHIDGDRLYLDKCMSLYEQLGVYAYGALINEENMAKEIDSYINQIRPEVIVVTGHDLYNGQGIKDLDNYSNTKNFIEAIKAIRKNPITINAVVIAGACQSNYEALIANGADFASSPKRINVHTFDPAVVAIKASTTSMLRVIQLKDALKYIENGKDAFGGIETMGKMRLIL